ncbi:MAG: DegT/DnrJ/EryC1/StrS family aminotransferase, partial [Thiohalocapsa sp.]
GPGDEVVVPAMSFVASANVVLRVGARPRFADVDLLSRNLTAESVLKTLKPRTRAIMPVHFAGRSAELDPIYELASANGLTVVEDAAQAIGTRYHDREIGASGNPVCFSFHPNKNMTTVEGGALAVADSRLVGRLERIRFHGIEKDADGNVDVPEWGGKMNMPDLGAALGLVQLGKLDVFNARRQSLAQRYLRALSSSDLLLLPEDAPGHSWHMFCICVDFAALGTTRSAFIAALRERGVAAGIHYPAIHLYGLYRRFGYGPGDFPNAERIGEQTLTLPLFPTMADADVDRVCEALTGLIDVGAGGADG